MPKKEISKHALYMRQWRYKKRLAEKSAPKLAVVNSTGCDPAQMIQWIENNLLIPSGPLMGQSFKIPNWQREWIISAYAGNIREAGLSISRKNGKSGLVAALLVAHLVGPANRPDWRCVVASLTGALAKELRSAVEQTAKISGLEDHIRLLKSPPPGELHGYQDSIVRFLAADRATGHAIGSDLVIIDEAGLLQENQRSLWNALISSTSGRDGRLWAISIQGDGPMFAEMEQRAEEDEMHFRKWTSSIESDVNDREAWMASNPGLADGIKSLKYMERMAKRAKSSPGNEMHFRAYDLNQPVDPEREVIVSINDYRKCRVEKPCKGHEVVIGLDLGGSSSMTCACLYWHQTGYMEVLGAFGDDPPLKQRADNDRMGSLYWRMAKEGHLRIFPGRTTPVVDFLRDVFAYAAKDSAIVAIGADRYRKAEAEQAFDLAGIPFIKVYWRGQGAGAIADGSKDVRAFQKIVMDQKLKIQNCTMLETAIANSVLRYDKSLNPALDKSTKNARIDALSSAVIAVGIGEFLKPAPVLDNLLHVVG